jgi:LPXTG-motif cell wall-anchored protein
VPSACRRIVVLLVVALMGVGGPVASVYAQGAGDQQYQDPFGNSDSGSGSSGSSGSGSSGSNGSGDNSLAPLSPSPQTSGGSGTTNGSGTAGNSATGNTTTSPATAATLPNTGLDTRILLLAGAVLLLAGVGLRMRNAPERF